MQFDVRAVCRHPRKRCLVVRRAIDDHMHPLTAGLVVPDDAFQEPDEAVSVELVVLEPKVELRFLLVNRYSSVDFAASTDRFASYLSADPALEPRVRDRARLLEDALVLEEDNAIFVRRFFLTPGRTRRSQWSCAAWLASESTCFGY